jgi:hypothetical protein
VLLEKSRQGGAIVTGCYSSLPAKDRGQMALVGEAGFLRYQSQRLFGPPHQHFCPFEPTLCDVMVRPNPHCLRK